MTKSRSVVAYGGWTENKTRRYLWGDGNVLYVDYSFGYISVYTCQKLSNYA